MGSDLFVLRIETTGLLFLTVFLLFSLSSCAGLPGKTYIIIQEFDRVAEFGKLKYVVEKGDILEVTERKTCKGGFGTCFEVRNVATNEYGYVKKSRMEKRHLIFTEPGETGTTTKTPRVEKINKVNASYQAAISNADKITVQALEKQRATQKAIFMASLVQSTSALEMQGLEKNTLEKMIHRFEKEFLTGSYKDRLWVA